MRYQGCVVWEFAAFWRMLFQLSVSPFNCINEVTKDIGEKVKEMLNEEASPQLDCGRPCRSYRRQ
jgi:hypothetical protein